MAQSKLREDEDPTFQTEEQESDRSPGGLVALAEAIGAAKGDLPGTLERMAQSLDDGDRRELLDEMLSLEQQNPGAFLAGALAGFALGRSAAGLAPGQPAGFASDGDSVYPGPERQEAGEAGVVSEPVETAQTGAGGPGYLETPASDDDKT